MAADYEALEARVSDLEHQIRNVLPQKTDAVAYGVSVLHEDVREGRRRQDGHGLLLDDMAERLARVEQQGAESAARQRVQAETQELHGAALTSLSEGQRALAESAAEILRRLPPPPAE